ncbi:MAG: hypothetical protein ACWA5L_06675 [bacterium]
MVKFSLNRKPSQENTVDQDSHQQRAGSNRLSALTGIFQRGKKNNDQEIDLSSPLARATHNPLKVDDKDQPTVPPADVIAALGAIEATFSVIEKIRAELIAASHLVLEAQKDPDIASRALLADQYDEKRQSIVSIASNVTDEAARLTSPEAKPIVISLSDHTDYTIDVVNLDIGEEGLNLPPPTNGFATNNELASILGFLDTAMGEIDEYSEDYMRDARFLMTRIEK